MSNLNRLPKLAVYRYNSWTMARAIDLSGKKWSQTSKVFPKTFLSSGSQGVKDQAHGTSSMEVGAGPTCQINTGGTTVLRLT